MSISTLLAPVASDLARLESMLHASVEADGELGRVARPLLRGGKRLRPALVLLSGALGPHYDFESLAPAALAVELVHLATLVHDDLIDRSETRRGVPTVWAKHGEAAAVVVADHYFSKGYLEASRTRRADVVADIAETVMRMCEGELHQQTARWKYRLSLDEYLRRIELKTALLLALSCRLGSLLSGMDEKGEAALASYGVSLGIAFQIADDVLDYTSTEESLGKPVAQDLLEGHVTLPVMLAMKDPRGESKLDAVLRDGEPVAAAAVPEVVEVVRITGGAERALEHARAHVERAKSALSGFPPSAERRALSDLADYVVHRNG